jgi:two-component system, OmpR family, alkaline phosphatase synthesis response regulator PhoP
MARILIVDDEIDVVDLVTYLLEREGHVILTARDGKEGLQRVREDAPDLIVMDIMMPEMDGYTMNKHLLTDAQARQIPVIVLTARGGLQGTSALAPNIQYHMEKPFDPKDLKDRIESILANKDKR